MSVSVCVCVSVCAHITGTASPYFTKFSVHIGTWLDPFLQRCDALRVSGFVDVMS